MPYDFTEYPPEPETQTSAGRGRRPPGKGVAVDDFEPPEPVGPSPPDVRGLLNVPRWLAALILGLLALACAVVLHIAW